MSSDEPICREARPVHRRCGNGFWIDETDVTNGEFIRATDRRYLEGTVSSIEICIDHPFLHIAYADAEAYAKWFGTRMPAGAGRAFAPSGGPSRKRFIWVNSFLPKGDAIALTFQEEFPVRNRYGAGYGSTAPIKAFPPSGYGPSENVWERTSYWYRYGASALRVKNAGAVRHMQGPTDRPRGSAEHGVAKRVHQGGLFLCMDQYRTRSMPSGCGKGATDMEISRLGIPLMRDAGRYPVDGRILPRCSARLPQSP